MRTPTFWTGCGSATTDEDHFFLAGARNPNNAVHWGKERSDEVRSTPLHSQKVTAWIAMRRGGDLIGPFFFEDERGHAVTVTTQRYLSTALEPFLEELKQIESIDHKTEWLQKDGAPPNTSSTAFQWLQTHFHGRLVSLKTEVPWASTPLT